MRWIILIGLCVALVASTKFVGKERLTRTLKNIAHDLLDDSDIEDLSSEDHHDNDNEDEDQIWRQPRHQVDKPRRRQQQQQQQKQCTTCGKYESRRPFDDEEEDDFGESEDMDTLDHRTSTRTHQKQGRREQVEPEKPCQPNYQLLKKLDKVNAQLAAKLHTHAKHTADDRNFVVSPVAVQLALAAINQGARGNTKRQINQLLDSGLPKNQNHNAYAALARMLKGQTPDETSRNIQIKSTTGVVLGRQSARDEFVDSVKKCFDGEVKKCDFRNQWQQCRDQINDWVSTKTGQKSHQPLSRNAVTKNTKLIAIGTMQVKTNWGKQFRKNLKTVQGQFYPLGDQQATPVKMLQATGDFNLVEDRDMRVLGVQTQDRQLTMYVVLPKRRHDLNKIEKQRLQYGAQLQQLLEECDSSKHTLTVQLPHFQIAYKMDAKQTLQQLGIEEPFDGDMADFGGIQQDEQLLKHGKRQTGGLEDVDTQPTPGKQAQQFHLNNIHTFATIQVSEQGLDSANGQKLSNQQDKQKSTDHEDNETNNVDQFVADHAFAFMVKHNPTNQLIFIGRLVDATQEPESNTE